MNEPVPDKPTRRPRYHGKHPQSFQEKYKEHQPDRYPDTTAKVLQSGKTPAGTHRSVMPREVLQVLALQAGNLVVDCTLGYGGHAREILSAIHPDGKLLGFDLDPIELPKTEARLRESLRTAEALKVWQRNFAGIAQVLAEEAPNGVDAIFADLGVSSMQLDNPERGFTFKSDGPLDMRMNPNRGLSAAELLSRLQPLELSRLLHENSDEPSAQELATAILETNRRQPIQTTHGLADVIRKVVAPMSRTTNPDAEQAVRRVFQALRIAVNQEFQALDALLRQLPNCLKPGGRVAILTFHSGEDRRVKAALKQGLQNGLFSSISRDVVRPSAEEQRANPRSSAAKLRFAIRCSSGG